MIRAALWPPYSNYASQLIHKNNINHYYYKIKQRRVFLANPRNTAYWKHVENIIDIGDSESGNRPSKQKRFWSFIKSVRKDSSGVAPLKKTVKCMLT